MKENAEAIRILVVEDEPALRETLVYNLSRQGYRVDSAADGKTGLEKARKLSPELLILDLMLPVLDGVDVCRIYRQESSTPILILTARDDELDRVLGLEIGADDYMTKPFSMRELLARVKAHLRRSQLDHAEASAAPPAPVLTYGNLELDGNRHEVRLEGHPVPIKPKEFELLAFLAHHQGQALSRELLLERVWGWDFIGNTRTVDVHVSWLREKIEPDPSQPVRIVTVRGAGYRFEG